MRKFDNKCHNAKETRSGEDVVHQEDDESAVDSQKDQCRSSTNGENSDDPDDSGKDRSAI